MIRITIRVIVNICHGQRSKGVTCIYVVVKRSNGVTYI